MPPFFFECRYDDGTLQKLLSVLLLALAATRAAAAPPAPEVLQELAPTGKLRVGINYGNPVLATKDRMGHLRGFTVDIAREIGRQSRLPVELVGYDRATEVVASSKEEAWDMAFISVPAAMTGEMAQTPPYIEVEITYLVHTRSRFGNVSDVDSPGVRIVVQERNSSDIFLSTRLMQAVLFRVADEAGALRLLRAGAAEAFASSKNRLAAVADNDSSFRVLEGRFAAIPHALAVPAERKAALAYLTALMEQLKASGFVQRAIDDSRVRGVVVLPAQASK